MKALAKRFGWWAAFLVLVCLPLGPAIEAQEVPKTQTRHCFWKAEGKSNTVYLLGSVHVLNKKFYPMAKPIEEAFQRSSILVLEVDLKDLESPMTQLQMLKSGMYQAGDSLRKNISKECYEKLDAFMKKRGGSASSMDGFKPWMVAVVLLTGELQKMGFHPNEGVDRYFYQKAQEDKKKVVGLETAAFQLSLFDDMSKEEGEAMLNETFDEIESVKAEFDKIIEAWKTGDTKKLDQILVEDMRQYPDLYKKLLLERNQRWIRQLEKHLNAGKDVFVVVGALHLVGKDSVVEMLKAKGYRVEQQ